MIYWKSNKDRTASNYVWKDRHLAKGDKNEASEKIIRIDFIYTCRM